RVNPTRCLGAATDGQVKAGTWERVASNNPSRLRYRGRTVPLIAGRWTTAAIPSPQTGRQDPARDHPGIAIQRFAAPLTTTSRAVAVLRPGLRMLWTMSPA